MLGGTNSGEFNDFNNGDQIKMNSYVADNANKINNNGSVNINNNNCRVDDNLSNNNNKSINSDSSNKNFNNQGYRNGNKTDVASIRNVGNDESCDDEDKSYSNEIDDDKSFSNNNNNVATTMDDTELTTVIDSSVKHDGKQYLCAPAPPVEIKLFVGRIPRTMTEDDVRPLFSKYGDVVEVAIIRDRKTSHHKGSAFVRMACIAEADEAIKQLNGQKVLDTSLGPVLVKYATGEIEKLGITTPAGEAGLDQAKLFVGSIPKSSSDADIKKLFDSYGTVDEVYLMRDSQKLCKGCAFVKFAYKEQAIHAKREMDGKLTLEGCARPLEVRFAESKSQRDQSFTSGMVSGGARGGTNQMNMNGASNRFMGSNHYGIGGMGMDSVNNCGNYRGVYNGICGILNTGCYRVAGPWKEYFNNDGRPYYHNEISNVTQWDRPVEFDQMNRMRFPRNSNGSANETQTGPAGSNIFIFHIPNEWTDHHLYGAFSQFGTIISASIAKDKLTGRNKGFGFVSYTNQRSAAMAVANMNGFMVSGKRLKVSVKQGEEDQAQLGSIPSNNGSSCTITNSPVSSVQMGPSNSGHMGNNYGPAGCNNYVGGMQASASMNSMMCQYAAAMQGGGGGGTGGQYGFEGSYRRC